MQKCRYSKRANDSIRSMEEELHFPSLKKTSYDLRKCDLDMQPSLEHFLPLYYIRGKFYCFYRILVHLVAHFEDPKVRRRLSARLLFLKSSTSKTGRTRITSPKRAKGIFVLTNLLPSHWVSLKPVLLHSEFYSWLSNCLASIIFNYDRIFFFSSHVQVKGAPKCRNSGKKLISKVLNQPSSLELTE